MGRQGINVVWLKRDLRIQDHAPLFQAEKADKPYLIVYCFEPSLIKYPDTSQRHLQFIFHSLTALNKELKAFDRRIEILHAEALEMFAFLQKRFLLHQVFSHRESGTRVTWDRDKEVGKYLQENGVEWVEFQKDAVLRGISNRKRWEKEREAHFCKNILVEKNKLGDEKTAFAPKDLPGMWPTLQLA